MNRSAAGRSLPHATLVGLVERHREPIQKDHLMSVLTGQQAQARGHELRLARLHVERQRRWLQVPREGVGGVLASQQGAGDIRRPVDDAA